jgi:hypothetical protein
MELFPKVKQLSGREACVEVTYINFLKLKTDCCPLEKADGK